MIVSVASGKGGTGKTTLAVNMALSLGDVQLLDCDVEEPNVHIFLNPEIVETKPVYVPTPAIDEERCDLCGRCSDFCSYNAIAVVADEVLVFPELCHGCGGCSIVCPRKAISEENREVGKVIRGRADGLEVLYGELKVGEPIPVTVINEVKKGIARSREVIIDSPPGTSCPVIASVYGSDYCILVTEPTPFGLNDLKLTVNVLREIKIPFGVVINRGGIGDREIYEYCEGEKIPILLEIPFNRRIAELYSQGIPFTSEMTDWKDRFSSLHEDIRRRTST
jgi:MinD superfamily P-loop ATPase